MSHPFTVVPMLKAENLPNDVAEWCWDHDCSLHCSHDIVEVDLEDGNPMFVWLSIEGYKFPLEAVKRGWGHVAILGS